VFQTADGQQRCHRAGCSRSTRRFLLLCRDGNGYYGTDGATSGYRSMNLLDTARATNIAGSPRRRQSVAPNGKLADGVMAAT
jgi:hypothetical protein